MTMGSGVRLRLYSGVHMGAEIALTEGLWVFGRDDSCDIVLADPGLAPRHAVLDVKANALRYENLDGRVESPEGEAPASAELEPGRLWRMGPVHFCLGSRRRGRESLGSGRCRAREICGWRRCGASADGDVEKTAQAPAEDEKRDAAPVNEAAASSPGADELASGVAGAERAANRAQSAHDRSGLKTFAVVIAVLFRRRCGACQRFDAATHGSVPD